MRRLIVCGVTGCGAVALLAAMAAGCGSASTSTAGLTASTARVVPWTGRPAPKFVAPEPLPATTPPTDAPPCRAADLKVTESRGSGMSGVIPYWIKITNEGRDTCIVRGYPRFVVAIEANRTQQRLRIGRDGFLQLEPSEMRPRGSVYLIISSEDTCGGGLSPTYLAAQIGWPGGGSVVVQASGAMRFPCSVGEVTTFGVVAPAPVYPPDPLGALRARLLLPARAVAGQLMRYVVELVNPTSRAISLRPCPGYLEAMTDLSAPVVKLEYALNCQQAGTVPAHGMVRFAMEMAVPATAASGSSYTVTVGWTLIAASPVSAHGHVRLAGGA